MALRRFGRILYRHSLPLLGIEKEASPQCLRQMITTLANHSGLCYVIMGGISGAAILNTPSLLENQYNSYNKNKSLLSYYMSRSAVPLFLLSFFCNLQGLMSSMMVAGHINGLPLHGIKLFVRRFPIIIGMTGWCLIPSVASLSFAISCTVHCLYDRNLENGLTYFSILLSVLFGSISTLQTYKLLRGNVIIRQKCHYQAMKRVNKYQFNKHQYKTRSNSSFQQNSNKKLQ